MILDDTFRWTDISGANPYTGFDRFGRIVDLLWQNYAGGGAELVHLKYGYDRASNRTFRQDVVATSLGKNFDELYEYDGIQRLAKFHRGRLTADKQTITSPAFQQGWQLDATGNWQNFTQNDQSDADNTLDQQRIANRVNEITTIARTVGANWATPSYDRNGNMTVIPQPKDPTTTFRGTWDAWNRLVKLEEPNGSGGWRTLAEYAYDGQTWRTVAKTYTAGSLTETRHAYFTSGWQNIEERLGTTPASATPDRQFIWGLRYIDDLVLRDRSVSGGTLNERLYSLADANWNVVAITDTSWSVQERYVYAAYGTPAFLSGAYAPLSESQFSWESLFTSRDFDHESSLFQFRHRYYNSVVGLFVTADPLPSGPARHEFVGGNPLVQTDPLGLIPGCVRMLDAGGPCSSDTCGPDVTDWFLGDLLSILDALKKRKLGGPIGQNFPGIGHELMILRDVAKYGLSYKWRDFSAGTSCGTGNCRHTVWFAGMCIRKNQLGNIAFGFLVREAPPHLNDMGAVKNAYGYPQIGTYWKAHPYAASFGSWAGKARADNLAAFSFGFYMGEDAGGIKVYSLGISPWARLLAGINRNPKIFDRYSGLVAGPKTITQKDFQFIPQRKQKR